MDGQVIRGFLGRLSGGVLVSKERVTLKMTDHESNEGITFAALIGLAGLIVATALATALLAHRVINERERELREINAVLDGVGFP